MRCRVGRARLAVLVPKALRIGAEKPSPFYLEHRSALRSLRICRVQWNGTTDTLTLKLLTRIGTNPDDTKCIGPGGSHNNAAGLRMYFDGVSNSSQFGADLTP